MVRKPSSRRHRLESNTELDITPIMNLMIVLVPFLLLAAVFSKTTILNIYLPSSDDTALSDSQSMDDELSVTVAITSKGFSIGGVEEEKIPDISFVDNDYNYTELSRQLKKLKEKYKMSSNIVLLIEPDIEYDIIVHTMDAAREIKEEGKMISLFPDVSLADSIIVIGGEDVSQEIGAIQ